MARVPGKMYRSIRQQAYTRREYMGGVPGNRILQYNSGNAKADFPVELHLVVEERGQLRHTALEAMRITAVRFMDKKAGRDNYHLRVRVYPHHVIRQNKQASGAGADRVSMGMRLSFGKPIGTAARVEEGQNVMTIRTVVRAIPFAKEAMRKAQNKIAMPCHVDFMSKEGRTLSDLMNEAAKQGGRALAGAGALTEETTVEEAEGSEGEDAEAEGDAADDDASGKKKGKDDDGAGKKKGKDDDGAGKDKGDGATDKKAKGKDK